MPLTLTYKADTALPIEVEGFTPAWAKDKTLSEIGQFEVFHGNQKRPLVELFDIAGSVDDLQFDFHGDLSGVHWIGAHMDRGEIRIHGPAGRHIGSDMSSGTIHVHGDALGWVGAEMSGGLIHVHGNAGHLVGAAYRGSTKGMAGGTILIDGDVGDEVGLAMRRGMIAVGGSAGGMLGFNMLAGTVIVFGECGIRPGAGMRRGTLGLLGPNRPKLLPSFRFACSARPQVLSLILNELRDQGFSVDENLRTGDCQIYNGDLVEIGRGEILLRHDSMS